MHCFRLSCYLLLSLVNFKEIYGGTEKIDPDLLAKLHQRSAGQTWDLIVEFQKNDTSLASLLQASLASVESIYQQAFVTRNVLITYATSCQTAVIQSLPYKEGMSPELKTVIPVETLWDDNDLFIPNANPELIYNLAEDKMENVNITRIRENFVFTLDPDDNSGYQTKPQTEASTTGGKALSYNLRHLGAERWWKAGYNGTGVIVGHIDSGVYIHHVSLKFQWLGKDGGWLDPYMKKTFPWESDKERSHGTHTLGTLVGRGLPKADGFFWTYRQVKTEDDVEFFGYGMAPGARWISCMGCIGKTNDLESRGRLKCIEAFVRSCMEFMNCPNPKGGCTYIPDVISCSWGCRQNEKDRCFRLYPLTPRILKWRKNGIIPVFAAGNGGREGCGTINDPADHDTVIAVGSTNEKDILSDDSNKGPPIWRHRLDEIKRRGLYKPDVLAPGVLIDSTVYDRGSTYAISTKSGTSMATPAVAGAIALLLSRTEKMTFEKVRGILANTTKRDIKVSRNNNGKSCGQEDDRVVPNHKLGYGRVLLPDPKDLSGTILPPERLPTRVMPPPPDFTGIEAEDDACRGNIANGWLMIINLNLLIVGVTIY